MSIGSTLVIQCPTCNGSFRHEVKGAGRPPTYCPDHRDSRTRKREEYDPWLWENTILEWDE